MRRSPLLPIFLVVLVDVFGMTLILPLLPFYAEHLGATVLEVGLLVSSFAACQFLSGPVLGALSDRYGRRRLLLVSQLGTVVGFALLASARSLAVVFLGRILDGATAGNLSLAQAYISDRTPREARARSFGLLGVAFGVGFLVGPAVSGFLAARDPRAPIILALGMASLSVLTTLVVLPRDEPPKAQGPQAGGRLEVLSWGRYRSYFRRPELRGLLVRFFLFAFSFAVFTSGFALFAERSYSLHGRPWGPREVGYVLALSGLLGAVLQGGLLGRLVKRFGEARLVTAGFLSLGMGYLLLAGPPNLGLLAVSAALAAFGAGALRPSLTSLVTQRAAADEQGVVLGFTQSLTSLAQLSAPLAGGVLLSVHSLEGWAILAAGASLLGLSVRSSEVPRSVTAHTGI